MKIRLTLFCFIFSVVLFAQSDYSTIHIMITKKADDKLYPKLFEEHVGSRSYPLRVNDSLIKSLSCYEELKIKVYSEGRIGFLLNDYPLYIDVKNGKDYYIARCINIYSNKNDYFKEVDTITWKTYMPIKKVTEIEEDLENPFGKIDKSKRFGKGQGTCFLLSSGGYLVTNHHLIVGAKEVIIKGIGGDFTTKYAATVVGSDPTNDLALLKLTNNNLKFNNPPFAIRSSGVAQAEITYALGFPKANAMGEDIKITDGIISAKSGVDGDISKFQVSAAVNHGNSGGPLIDEQGNLIGVIFAKSTIAESAGYAVKASYLETFLKNIDGFEMPTLINTIKDKPLTEKVAELKNYIFIVEAN